MYSIVVHEKMQNGGSDSSVVIPR